MVAHQEIISNFQNLLCLLSSRDNLKMFSIAKDGLRVGTSTVDTLKITHKRYYKALKQLKDAGLIEKDNKGYYTHTTFGSIVYQRNIVEMEYYILDIHIYSFYTKSKIIIITMIDML